MQDGENGRRASPLREATVAACRRDDVGIRFGSPVSPPTAPPPVASLFDLSGRVAIVTGAGAGIGAGIATRFAAAGAAVVVHYDRNLAGATSVVREIEADGGRAAAVAADLTNTAAADDVVDFSSRTLGVATIVVNNAGTYPLATIRDMTEAQWRSVIDANLTTTHLMTQAATRGMLAGGFPGAIVNIASIEAANVAPAHAHYGAAKAACADVHARRGARVRSCRHPRERRLARTDLARRARRSLAATAWRDTRVRRRSDGSVRPPTWPMRACSSCRTRRAGSRASNSSSMAAS